MAVAAVGAMVAALLALLGATAPPAAAADSISFRAAAQAAWNQRTARVPVPDAVRETDGMLLFVTTNRDVNITTPPAGWTLEGTRLSSVDTETTLYSKAAAANDAGRNVAVTFSVTTKASLTLLSYDGTAADPVATFASAAETQRRTSHTTPGAPVATAGSYVVSYWADKAGTATSGWTLPAGQTQRSIIAGIGTGRISAVASDPNAPAAVGDSPGLTATSAVSSRKATMWTVVLQPDPGSDPNVAPVASFTASCPTATCTVDGSGSTDTAPGTIASYAWDFGDGTNATGASTTHTYTSSGSKTIALTVTDDQGLTDTTTRVVDVTVIGEEAGHQGVPGHDRLVPDRPRTNTPRISNGEIWDIEVIPELNRVFIAGSFTSIQNTTGTNTGLVNQAGLASYNYQTGLIDMSFRPTFNGGVAAVEASPDGTKLFVGGSFSSVNGVARQKVASLNLTTGAPVAAFDFDRSTNNQVQSLAVSNDTVYVGGRYSRINGILKTGLAAVNAASGAVDGSFDNNLSGGIGVNGQLGVPQLKLTHDNSKLLVVHTGRQIDGQDRYGMGIIDTATKELLPWRSTLWDDYLQYVGGVTRICCADIAPDDSYFVVSSGSGGDRPPISDTAIAYPLDEAALQNPRVEPRWIARHFDSIYSVAITEVAVYVGGHFGFIESPSAEDPWPGLDNVGYGTGQGLAGYGLGDQVVRRDHIAAINPADGKALEWYSASNSFEGDKAMEATPRGLFVGGDGQFKGGVRTGRVGFYDFNTVADPPALPDTTILTPIEGRVVTSNTPFTITGTARVASGTVGRVQVQIQDRDSRQWLQDDGTSFTTFGNTSNSLNATLEPGTGTTRSWSIPATIASNRNLVVFAQAFTAPSGGTGDSTKADKWFESFSTEDQTPTTSISGPRGIQTSTTFTMTGTANDDHGINSLSYWFRDEQNRYLQDDGTVDSIFNTFTGQPDVIGATAATWSYEVTLPHEGEWRGSATARDTAGQADLRSATRDWLVDSDAVAPTVTIGEPVAMTPPFAVPTVVVEPGEPLTFSGTAADEEGLKDVEVSLRNTTTGESLGADGTWGVNVRAGQHRISPVNISGATYDWSYTTPFDLSPGTYSFSVRATDDVDLTTSSTNQGRLTLDAQVPGDVAPSVSLAFTPPTDESLSISLSGTASDDFGIQRVGVRLQDTDTGRYLQPDGTMLADSSARLDAVLGSPGATSTTWNRDVILPTAGDWRFTAFAYDTAGQQRASSTASYRVYPNDGPPSLSDTLGQPQTGGSFSEGKIVVTGRAEDAPDANAGIAEVELAVVNAAGQYMSSSGTFGAGQSWRNAFLNSPGSAGSNYSYTTPVIPDGTYSVHVRAIDVRDQVSDDDPLTDGDQPRIAADVTVTSPPNDPPVASFTYTCAENVCTFDGRSSTDEEPTSLTYSWSFGSQGTATGPLPTKTFTAPGTFAVTLTVRDEWTLTNTSAPQDVTIVEPPGNSPPVPTFARSCNGLTCSVSSQGTSDPDAGDVIGYSWSWGDGTTPSSGASPSPHTYAAPGTYTITLTTTDGWGNSASVSHDVTMSEPPGNSAPNVTFTATCASFTLCQMNSAGTADPDGDAIKYAWSFGDGGTSTGTNPSRTYATTGTYTITLTVTDVWGKATTVTHDVTITEPADNNAPTAVIAATSACSTLTTCAMSGTGSSDPDGASGDGIRNYVWNWGDGTPDTVATSVNTSHVYQVDGTYTVTLTVLDKWGRASESVTQEMTTQTEPPGNEPPNVALATGCTGLTCTANPSGTTDTDGGIRNYVYDWGDGSAVTTTTSGSTRSKTYAVAGTYTITLTVTDNWGRSTTVTSQVTTT